MHCALAGVVALATSACAVVDLRQAPPSAAIAAVATVPGLPPAVRSWGDEAPRDVIAEIRRRAPSIARLATHEEKGRLVVSTLALSGGGTDGAFGAGLLAGWSAAGTRPKFEVVTGISAGAIIAPFAFLGPRYDKQLEEVWTEFESSDLVIAQFVPGVLGGPALLDNSPLQTLMARYVTKRFLAEVAAEYRRGRLLLIGTTNLDAQRPVVWNMGEIALKGDEAALALFRKVILASASIPGVFPPVHFGVQAEGRTFEEMHVDGGVTREVFVAPIAVPLGEFDKLYPQRPHRKIYVVKNGKIAPEFEPVKETSISIASRALVTLTRSQHLGDIYRIRRETEDVQGEFYLRGVPASFSFKAKKAFDPEYQRALFQEGYKIGLMGGDWLHPSGPAVSATAVR